MLNRNIFSFVKYVKPGWYFLLPSKKENNYWVDIRKIDLEDQRIVDIDHDYEDDDSKLRDAAYQLLLKGYISVDKRLSLTVSDKKIPISDEYRFIRRYYHQLWVWYIFFLRCIAGHNPFYEWKCFVRAKRADRVKVYSQMFLHTVPTGRFVETDLVSVIIPTLNRYTHLENILRDLEKQTFASFEVLVIDQSDPFQSDFYNDFKLKLRIIRQEKPALWKARNLGILESKGDWIAFSEDDVRVNTDWLEKHLACVEYFNTDISSGIFFAEGGIMPQYKSCFRWSEQLATGNALIKRSVFEKIGLFDLQFEGMRMGDGEFGLRAYLAGVRSISNPKAFALDVKAPEGGLRQMGSWDSWRPRSILAPRPVPSVLYLYRKYFGNRIALIALVSLSLPSLLPYRLKNNKTSYLLLPFLFPVVAPFLLIQTGRSWYLSGLKLKRGSIIPTL